MATTGRGDKGKEVKLTEEQKKEAEALKRFNEAWLAMDILEQKTLGGARICDQIKIVKDGKGEINTKVKLNCDLDVDSKPKEIEVNIKIAGSEIKVFDKNNNQITPPIKYDEKEATFSVAFSEAHPPKAMVLDLAGKSSTFRLGANQQRNIYNLQQCVEQGAPSQLGINGPASGKSWIQGMTALALLGARQASLNKTIFSVPKADLAKEFKEGAIDKILPNYGIESKCFISGDHFNSVAELKQILDDEKKTAQIILLADDPLYAEYANAVADHRVCIDEAHLLSTGTDTQRKALDTFIESSRVLALTGTPTMELMKKFPKHMIDINTYHAVESGKVRRTVFHEHPGIAYYAAESAALSIFSNVAYHQKKPGIKTIKEHMTSIQEEYKQKGVVLSNERLAALAVNAAMKDAEHNINAKGMIISTDPETRQDSVSFINAIRNNVTPKDYKDNQIDEFCRNVYSQRQGKELAVRAGLYHQALKELGEDNIGVKVKEYEDMLGEGNVDYAQTFLTPDNPRAALREELETAQKNQIRYSLDAMTLSLFLNVPLKDIEAEIKNNKIDKRIKEARVKLPDLNDRSMLEELKNDLDAKSGTDTAKLLRGLPENQQQGMKDLIIENAKRLHTLVKRPDLSLSSLPALPIDLDKLGAKSIVNVDDVVDGARKEDLTKQRDQALAQIRCGLVQTIAAGKELATGTDIQTLTSTVILSHDSESSSPIHITQAQARGTRSGGFDIAFNTHINAGTAFIPFNPKQAGDAHFMKIYLKALENEEKFAKAEHFREEGELKTEQKIEGRSKIEQKVGTLFIGKLEETLKRKQEIGATEDVKKITGGKTK